MKQEGYGHVTVIIRATVDVQFVESERATALTKQDARQAAIGSVPERVWEDLAGEGFEVDVDTEILDWEVYDA